MDIEQLSKSQIILLTLLVSFVTSIATGIVTVSLMDQAPPAIAQTINRVIEHTVERVVPGQTAATVVTQEKTVVVKEADLVAEAVQKISPSIVRLYSRDETSPDFIGLAVVLDKSGMLVADSAALGDTASADVALSDGTRVPAFVTSRDEGNSLAFLRAATSTTIKDQIKPIVWIPATISSEQSVLGESVVALSGKTVTRIADGIVTALIPAKSGDVIDTSISAESIGRGSPLITTDGIIIGVSTAASRASSLSGFLSTAVLLPKPQTTASTDAAAKK